MKKIGRIIYIVFSIIKEILIPELKETKHDIISEDKIDKLNRLQLISEYIKSRRRLNDYLQLADIAFKRQYKFLLLFCIALLIVDVVSFLYKFPFDFKIGDALLVPLPFLPYIWHGIKIVYLTPGAIYEEKISEFKLPKLRETLKQALDYEWWYMDLHNKRIASTYSTIGTLVFLMLPIVIKKGIELNRSKISVEKYIDTLPLFSCGNIDINIFDVHVLSCDYYSGINIAISCLSSFVLYQFSVVFSGIKGSGYFFKSQGFKQNYISSVYLDSISLSRLNPSQNEAI